MPRVSLYEQYDNKDVIQQIYLLISRVDELADQMSELITQFNLLVDYVGTSDVVTNTPASKIEVD